MSPGCKKGINILFFSLDFEWVWVASSVVERCPDKTEVIGSIPMLPTKQARLAQW